MPGRCPRRVWAWSIQSILRRYSAAATFRTGHPSEHPCPGDLDGEVVPCPYITLEIEMPRTATESTTGAGMELASSILSDPDPDCHHGDPRSIARATRAAQASHQSGRRRLVDPTTCDRDYAAAELEFMQAMQEYKQRSGRMFPTWSEVLEVLGGLGYEKATGDRAVHAAPSTAAEVATGPHLESGQSRRRVTRPVGEVGPNSPGR